MYLNIVFLEFFIFNKNLKHILALQILMNLKKLKCYFKMFLKTILNKKTK